MKLLYLTLISLFCFTVSFSQEKTINEFIIEGNKKTKSSFIKKITTLKQGELLDSLKIEDDIKRLKRLASIAFADYKVFDLGNGTVNVTYNIEENFTIIPSLNVYTTNDDEFAYRVGLYEFNLLGQNMTIGGFYQNDIFGSYAAFFRAPYLFSRQFGLAVNHQNLQTLEPIFFNDTQANYKYHYNSIEFMALYEINFKNRVELGLNLFKEDYEYRSGAVDPEVPLQVEANKFSFKGIYEYNHLDFEYQYVSGFRSLLNLHAVFSNSDMLPGLVIGWNDFFYYKRIGKKGNWANRLRLGLSSNNDIPFAPFSVDNNVNIRGVGNVIDRGTGSIVLNTEYRYTLLEKGWFVLQGNAFVDSGTWRNPGGELDDFVDSDNLKVYSGVGLRFIHKTIFNAIFRIDYGVGLTNNSTRGFVFGIGQYF